MSQFRDSVAASFRALPRFRGKSHLGAAIGRLLIKPDRNEDSIATIRMRDGSRMRIDVRSQTERWAYWTGEYDHQIISRLSACLQPGWTVFDVGANVGFYSIALGNKLKALGGALHAFEPVRSNFDRLMHCIELNSLQAIVRAHNVALGDQEGTIDLHMQDTDNASTGNAVMLMGKVIEEDRLSANARARLTPLDTFAPEQRIERCDLIKIDVEGAEVMFLRGGSTFLSKHRPIIYGEFSPYWLKQFGHSFLDVADIVVPWEYRFFQETERAQFHEITRPEAGLSNVLLCPSETPQATLAALGVKP